MTIKELVKVVAYRKSNILSRDELTLLLLNIIKIETDFIKIDKFKDYNTHKTAIITFVDEGITREYVIIEKYKEYYKEKLLKNLNLVKKDISIEIAKEYIFDMVKSANDFKTIINNLTGLLNEMKDKNVIGEPYDLVEGKIEYVKEKQTEFKSLLGKTKTEYYDVTVKDYYKYSILSINNDTIKTDFDLGIYVEHKQDINFDLDNINFEKYDFVIINKADIDKYYIPNVTITFGDNYSKEKLIITNQQELSELINYIISKREIQRVKIIQSEVDEQSWYSDKINKELLTLRNEITNLLNEYVTKEMIWFTDCSFMDIVRGIEIERIVTKSKEVKIISDSAKDFIKKLEFERGDFSNTTATDIISEREVDNDEREELLNYFNEFIEDLEK